MRRDLHPETRGFPFDAEARVHRGNRQVREGSSYMKWLHTGVPAYNVFV